jgi:DNA-directed RNA polymerase specialized sigma24 family protein
LVLLSAQSQTPGCDEALADLCKLYWYPLYAFIRHRGYSPEDAQDLVQGFFLRLIEYRTLTRVDRSKGKFRSFLLASLQNYLANEADRARCLKRGGKVEFVFIDLEEAEDRYGLEPVEGLTPEKIFDARWAMVLLGEAMNRLSHEYMAQGKATTFEALRTFLDPTSALPSHWMSRVLKPQFQHWELSLGPRNMPALNSSQDSRLISARISIRLARRFGRC